VRDWSCEKLQAHTRRPGNWQGKRPVCNSNRRIAGDVSAGSSHSLTGPALCRCIGKMGSDSSLTSRKSGERAAREERLAKALRENLRRRKEQVRAQEQRRCPPDKDPRGGGSEPPA